MTSEAEGTLADVDADCDGLRPAQPWRRRPDPDTAAIQALYLEQQLNTVQIAKRLGITVERVTWRARASATPSPPSCRRWPSRTCPATTA